MENILQILLVDDEPLALDVLETYINQLPDARLLKRCSNALEANEALNNFKVDVIFLDIQMPMLTGVEFIKTLSKPPLFVFTTAYPNFAVEGFELNAIDYLLKPISFDRFLKAINKVREILEFNQNHSISATQELNTNRGNDALDFFFVKADKKLIKVSFDDIIYIEGLKDYVIIRTVTGRIITLQTMKSLEDRLPSFKFRRIHRSFIVSLDKINAIEGNMVEVSEKGVAKGLPIGKNYRDDLLELIERNRLK